MKVDYYDNANERVPCILVLDASWSMNERDSNGKKRIQELNEGLSAFQKAITTDEKAKYRVQVCIVIVGGPTDKAEVLMEWTDAKYFEAFPLEASGGTPLAEGISIGLEMARSGTAAANTAGLAVQTPWMFVISDGEPTSRKRLWEDTISEIIEAQEKKEILVYPVGVDGADIEKLSELITPSDKDKNIAVQTLSSTDFKAYFKWISDSLSEAQDRVRPDPTDFRSDPTDYSRYMSTKDNG